MDQASHDKIVSAKWQIWFLADVTSKDQNEPKLVLGAAAGPNGTVHRQGTESCKGKAEDCRPIGPQKHCELLLVLGRSEALIGGQDV